MVNKFSKIVVLVFLLANLGMAEYIKKDDAVYYMDKISQTDERKVEDADFKTFVKLNDIYGKDSKNVFCIDKKLEDADVKTFQVIGEVNGKDKKYIYNYDEKMEINPKDFKLYKNKNKLLYFRNNGKLYIGGSFFEVEYVQDLDSFEAIDESYSKDRYNIYYAGTPIYDVDKSTFQIIMPDYYAKDKNNVYSGSDKIKDANPDTIKILNQVYLKDDKNVFLNFGQKMENVDVATFEAIEGNVAYGKDKNNIYFLGEKIKGADVKSFEVILEPSDLVQMYSKDKNSVFIGGRKIKEADSKTFERLPKTTYYSKDKNNLYYREVKIDKIDNKTLKILYSDGIDVVKNRNRIFAEGKKLNIKSPETFEIILSKYYNFPNFIYGKDDKNVYAISKFDETYSSKIIKNADVNSFEVMKNSMYTKDKNNIYYSNRKIIGADLPTFQIGSDGFSKDKNNIYFGGKKILGVDRDTIKIIELPYIKDKNNVYYGNKKIEGADKNTFELTYDFKSVVNNYYSKDKNNVYYENKKLKGIDVKTFKKVGRLVDNFLIEDKNGFYIVEEDGSVAPIDGKEVDIENLSQLAIKTNLYHDKDSMYFVKNHKLVKIKDAPKVDPYNLSTYNDKYINKYNVVYYLDTDEGAFKKLEKAESHQFSAYGNTEYAKGRKNVYFKGKILADADYESFGMKYNHEKDVYEIRDKNKVYETVKAD